MTYGVEIAFRSGHADRGFIINDRPVVQPVMWFSGSGVGAQARDRARPCGHVQGCHRAPGPRRSGGVARSPRGVLMLTVELERVDRDAVRSVVAEQGAMRIRGLELRDAAEVEAVFRQLGDLMTETEAFAPRTRYAPGVYSATKWPPNQPMCVHHELSYAYEVPSLMLFACLVAPEVGGATPLADGAGVLGALPRALVERFERQGWLPLRYSNGGIGATIAYVLGPYARGDVACYCRVNVIQSEPR